MWKSLAMSSLTKQIGAYYIEVSAYSSEQL